MNRTSTDRVTVQMVAGFLGLSGLLIISGLILLASLGRDIPEPLSTLGGAAIGALGSLLARTATEERGPVAVEVHNSPTHPIPVESNHQEEENHGTSLN